MPSPGTRTDEAMIRAVRRNPHAMNKRSRGQAARQSKFQAYTVSQLLETYRDPRAVLLEIASTETAVLAEQAGMTKAEALAERRLCAQAVLPYVCSKMPVEVDVRRHKVIHLNVIEPGAEVPAGGHTLPPGKFETLQELATGTQADDSADAPALQLLTNVRPVESGAAGGDRTHVHPAVSSCAPSSGSEPTR